MKGLKIVERWTDLPTIFERGYHFVGDARTASHQVEFAHRLLALPAGSLVLMPFCGSGFYAIEMALWGYYIVGWDPSSPLLSAAERKAEEEGVILSLKTGSLVPSGWDVGTYDGAMVLGNRFGLTGQEETDRQFLGDLSGLVRENGHLVLALPHRDGVLKDWKPKDWEDLWDGSTALISREWDATSGYAKEIWTVLRSAQKEETLRIAYRVYTASEFSRLMDQTGFVVTKVLGGYTGSALAPEHTTMLIQAVNRNPKEPD